VPSGPWPARSVPGLGNFAPERFAGLRAFVLRSVTRLDNVRGRAGQYAHQGFTSLKVAVLRSGEPPLVLRTPMFHRFLGFSPAGYICESTRRAGYEPISSVLLEYRVCPVRTRTHSACFILGGFCMFKLKAGALIIACVFSLSVLLSGCKPVAAEAGAFGGVYAPEGMGLQLSENLSSDSSSDSSSEDSSGSSSEESQPDPPAPAPVQPITQPVLEDPKFKPT